MFGVRHYRKITYYSANEVNDFLIDTDCVTNSNRPSYKI